MSEPSSTGNPTIVDPNKLSPIELWRTEVAYAEQELKKFYERGRKVVRRYVDERDAIDAQQKWFNLFYANTKIMRAALYAQMPKPEVKRKYLDYKDQLGRVAASILQRAIEPDCDDPRDLFDSTMRSVTLDRLLPGLGQAWCRLETDSEDAELILESAPSVGEGLLFPHDHHNEPLNSGFKTGPAPDEGQPISGTPPAPIPGPQGMSPPEVPGQPPAASPLLPKPTVIRYKRITDQRVVLDYVYWEDFLWSPCRVWEERRWVGRVVHMDRDQLVKRFGKEKGEKVPLNYRPVNMNLNTYPGGITPVNQAIKQARVYELWDRIHRKVVWFCKDYPEILDEKDDFLNLIGFEPCPRPLFANITTSNTVPRPDYYIVQDQYQELDTVNNRISMLVRACKVAGVYDRASEGVQRLLQEGTDNILVPVDNWAMFAEKGGVKGQVDWLPLEQIVNALQRLYEAREGIKAQIYEVTGIADIVRGASKASETLGAQEIKAKFASVRIKDTQDEVARFASELLRIKAEIMVKHFDPEIMIRKSNILRTDDADMAQEAVELLQSEEGFEWRITVTSDQLAQTDYAMEKQDRVELLTSVSGYLEKAGPMIMQKPETAPFLVGMLKWAISGFKGARDIEGMLERTLDDMTKNPPPQQPDPEAEKAKQEMQMAQEEHQMRMQEAQMKLQGQERELQLKIAEKQQELQMSAAENQQELRFEVQRMQLDLQMLRMQHMYDMQCSQQEHEQKMRQTHEQGQAKVQVMKAAAAAKPKVVAK